jgi:predicted ribosome quality control (RQC) complex YloA/Tae2 family protein
MYEYTSYDSISIKVGQNAKENDELTMTSDPKEWWMHVSGYPGSHVVICCDGETVPKETKRDAAVLAVHHSKSPSAKMTQVDFVRLDQVSKYTNTSHGQVYLDGEVMQLTVFMNKEKSRLDRLLKNRRNH